MAWGEGAAAGPQPRAPAALLWKLPLVPLTFRRCPAPQPHSSRLQPSRASPPQPFPWDALEAPWDLWLCPWAGDMSSHPAALLATCTLWALGGSP